MVANTLDLVGPAEYFGLRKTLALAIQKMTIVIFQANLSWCVSGISPAIRAWVSRFPWKTKAMMALYRRNTITRRNEPGSNLGFPFVNMDFFFFHSQIKQFNRLQKSIWILPHTHGWLFFIIQVWDAPKTKFVSFLLKKNQQIKGRWNLQELHKMLQSIFLRFTLKINMI